MTVYPVKISPKLFQKYQPIPLIYFQCFSFILSSELSLYEPTPPPLESLQLPFNSVLIFSLFRPPLFSPVGVGPCQ